MQQEVPESWTRHWGAGPGNPAVWLKAFMQKTQALAVWLEKMDAGTLLNGELDLSDLFHPDTFLNAIRQQTARYMLNRPVRILLMLAARFGHG